MFFIIDTTCNIFLNASNDERLEILARKYSSFSELIYVSWMLKDAIIFEIGPSNSGGGVLLSGSVNV